MRSMTTPMQASMLIRTPTWTLVPAMLTQKLIPAMLLALVFTPAAALAADTGARLYATCAGCHGTNGAGTGGALPVLAGQSQEALAASLRAFKAGTRPSTIMQQIAKGYSDEQIAQLAAFLAAQKR